MSAHIHPAPIAVFTLADAERDWDHTATVETYFDAVALCDWPEGMDHLVLTYAPEDAERIGQAMVAAARRLKAERLAVLGRA